MTWTWLRRGNQKRETKSISISEQNNAIMTNYIKRWKAIPGRVIAKTLKMVHNAGWLNTQHYKVRVKGKVDQSRE